MSSIGDLIDDLSYPLRRRLRAGGEALGDFWFERSLEIRRRTAGVIGLIALYALLKLVVGPVLPCRLPAGKECPPNDAAAKIVPGDALLYAHLSLDSGQYDEARGLSRKLPHAQTLLSAATANLPIPSGGDVDLSRDIEPWRGDEAALARLPGPGGGDTALLVASRDDRKALAFANRIGPGKPHPAKYRKHRFDRYSGGFAAAIVDGFLVAGEIAAVRDVIDTARLPGSALAATNLPKSVREPLPEQRFADVYLSRQGIRAFLAGRGGYAGQLDTFTDYSASRGIAASAQAHGDGIEFQLESALQHKQVRRHPPFFKAFGPFEPGLADELSDEALVYLGMGDLGASLNALLAQASKTAPGLARGLKRFRSNLSARAKIDIARKVVPLLSGQAALAVEPTASAPYAALIVDGVDEKRTAATIAKLASPIAKAARAGGSVASTLSVSETDGVKATSIRLSPAVNLTFAAFGGKLVVATDPAGVKEVRSGKAHLSGTDAYRKALAHVGGEVSALVFLNLEESFGLAERAGLAENLTYATFAEDIHTLKALGVGVDTLKDRLSTKFFLTIE